MGDREPRRLPDESERLLAWERWLEGDSVGQIHRYDLRDHSLAVVRRILEEDEPPEAIREDIRYRLGARFGWISANGLKAPGTEADQPFVVIQIPRRTTGKVFAAAVRAIRREVRALGSQADLELHIIESIEPRVAVSFVNERGYRGYAFDAEGTVTPIGRIEAPEPEPAGPAP